MRLGPYEVSAANGFGPRVTGLRRDGGPEFFAHLDDDVVLEHSPTTVYRLRGGHRLWAAPEVPEISYAPDDLPCAIAETDGGFSIISPIDLAGLQKVINMSLDGERLAVDHRLTNRGSETIVVAPWAITMFRLGGLARLRVRNPTPNSDLQADRTLVLWPYSSLSDPRLSFHDDVVEIEGRAGPALKLGSGPDPGQLEYHLDGFVFTKEIVPAEAGGYADLGAVGQVFVKDLFLELESLGPMTSLGSGDSIDHREVWEIFPA